MSTVKYYDYKHNRPLDLDSDGCVLEKWDQLHGKAQFAKHPKGFNIFIPPGKISANDEYAAADPYSVEQNIDGQFHQRRIELTIELLREAVASIPGKPQVLDLGCGQGHITEKMRQAVPGAEFTGSDYSVSAIEYAHDHFPLIDFAAGDVYDSYYAQEFFDVVVCNNLWEHVPDPLFLLSNITRTLKPGGFLIVSTPSRYRSYNLVRVLRGKPVEFMSPHHVTEYTVGQVIEQLAYGGFKVTRILSRPISTASLKASIARWMFARLISLVGSQHQLEATVFYLARKTAGGGGKQDPRN
jgi:2-polyprenyl-3-methyl-5-hydroxy-6-metoxy-1,4-benzoquinol methylase